MKQGEIIKVTFEYENVTKHLSKEDSQKFVEILNNMTTFMHLRKQNPFEKTRLNWIEESKP